MNCVSESCPINCEWIALRRKASSSLHIYHKLITNPNKGWGGWFRFPNFQFAWDWKVSYDVVSFVGAFGGWVLELEWKRASPRSRSHVTTTVRGHSKDIGWIRTRLVRKARNSFLTCASIVCSNASFFIFKPLLPCWPFVLVDCCLLLLLFSMIFIVSVASLRFRSARNCWKFENLLFTGKLFLFFHLKTHRKHITCKIVSF